MELAEHIQSLLGYQYTYLEQSSYDMFLYHIIRAGCSYREGDFKISREKDYAYCTIHYIFEGYLFYRVQEKEYLLKKGDFFIILPGEAHSYGTIGEQRVGLLWVEMSGSNCVELMRCFRVGNLFALVATYDEKACFYLISILEYLKGESKNKYDLSGKIYLLVLSLIEAADHGEKIQPSPLIQQGILEIDHSFTGSVKIAQIAEKLHVSNAYFTKVFKKQTGVTPVKYLNLKRIEYACHLLLSTELSCEAICEKAGIYDNAHFHRLFKRTLGMTPNQYRNK